MINNIMKNFKQEELILLAGCPDSGKTALVAEMAKYMAVEEKQDVLFFSLQHEKQDLIDRTCENTFWILKKRRNFWGLFSGMAER